MSKKAPTPPPYNQGPSDMVRNGRNPMPTTYERPSAPPPPPPKPTK